MNTKNKHHNLTDSSSWPEALLFLLLLSVALCSGKNAVADSELVSSKTPKLVVQITVDQLRGDHVASGQRQPATD